MKHKMYYKQAIEAVYYTKSVQGIKQIQGHHWFLLCSGIKKSVQNRVAIF